MIAPDAVARFRWSRSARGTIPDGYPKAVGPVFRRWIRTQRLTGGPWIDVADYSHVVGGPGVLLVGQKADLGLAPGRYGLELSWTRKHKGESPFGQRLLEALGQLAAAAGALEADTPLRFGDAQHRLVLLDQLNAPPTAESAAVFQQMVRDTLHSPLGSVTVEERDARLPLRITVRDATLLGRDMRIEASS